MADITQALDDPQDRNQTFLADWSALVARFAQHTRLTSTKGNADKLVAKFLAAADLQRDNDACELMLVGRSASDEDIIYVTEVWSSEAAWKQARGSKAVTAWAKDIPALVAEWPPSTRLTQIGGKGLE